MTLKNLKYKLRHKNDKIIFVNPTILLDKLEKTSYGVRQPSKQICNRVQQAKEFILKNWDNPRAKIIPMFEPSIVGIYGDPKMEYISFEDGRHRILAAEELGILEVAIEIPRKQEPKFEYMKVKPTNENILNESPDVIFKYKIHCYQNDAVPFICYQYKNDSIDIEVGKPKATHSNLPIKQNTITTYSGRLWLNKKIISFWKYPNKEIFIKTINKLEIKLNTKIWNDNWKIEILLYGDEWYEWTEENIPRNEIIPIEDYLKSENFPEELKQKHIMSWKEKEDLRKLSTYPNKQKPLEWKQALYQESTKLDDISKILIEKNESVSKKEKIITKFKDFEFNI